MSVYDQMTVRIIREQELVIGPLAWTEAQKVEGLTVIDRRKREVQLTGEPKETINRLVAQYERLFGRVSHETCKEAVVSLIAELSPAETPSSLLPSA